MSIIHSLTALIELPLVLVLILLPLLMLLHLLHLLRSRRSTLELLELLLRMHRWHLLKLAWRSHGLLCLLWVGHIVWHAICRWLLTRESSWLLPLLWIWLRLHSKTWLTWHCWWRHLSIHHHIWLLWLMVRIITTWLSELEYRLIRGVHWDFLCFTKVVSLPLIRSSSLPSFCLERCF